MVLVFILLGIFIFLMLLIFILLSSTLRIEIKKLEVTNMPNNKKKVKSEKININNITEKKDKFEIKNQFKLKISLYLWNKIKWIGITLNEEKIRKIISKINWKNIDVKKLEHDVKIEGIEVLKALKIKISQFKLHANVGLESPIITAFLIAIVSSVISIMLSYFVKDIKQENKKSYEYNIAPIYQNKNLYKIKLNCIIELEMVHIINVIFILMKKGKSDENERTTSNRKSYGYSYE